MASQRKSVLITGCSPGGIGHSLAEEFHAKGLRVFATARNKSVLSDLELQGIETVSLDVTSTEDIEKAKVFVESQTGGTLDFLVNNAGRNYTVPALDVDFDEVKHTFETNVFAVMRVTKILSPLLLKAQGTIVNIGSIVAYSPYVFGSTYNASKAALHSYSDTLRIELAPYNVKVIVIVTGGVKSRIARIERTLPPDSLYLQINDDYQRRLTHSQDGTMPNKQYAKSVVSHVLKSNASSWFWEGYKARQIWFIWAFLPQWIWGNIYSNMFGLNKLASINAALKKKS